jgi:hypothetical protein
MGVAKIVVVIIVFLFAIGAVGAILSKSTPEAPSSLTCQWINAPTGDNSTLTVFVHCIVTTKGQGSDTASWSVNPHDGRPDFLIPSSATSDDVVFSHSYPSPGTYPMNITATVNQASLSKQMTWLCGQNNVCGLASQH